MTIRSNRGSSDAAHKSSKLVRLIAGVVAVAMTFSMFIGCSKSKTEAPTENPAQTEETNQEKDTLDFGEVTAHHTNAYGFNSWSIHIDTDEEGNETYSYMDENGETVSVSAEELEGWLDQTIATCGDMTLTNRNLPFFYDQQFYSFYMSYGSYMSYFMDQSLALDEQMSIDGASTWQQYFLNAAVAGFQQTVALYNAAMEAGFELSEEEKGYLDTLEADLAGFAAENGFESAEDYLLSYYGPGVSMEDYKAFVHMNQLASAYANQLASAMEFTEEELSNYYDENQEMILQNYNVEKDDTKVIDVRHILIQPEDTESDDSWTAAEAKANELLETWKSGDATEESFADLATENTQDPGSAGTGGLYEGVYPGQMVPEFNDWCFEEGRQTGDTAIVKTDYGYHIMYFVGQGDTVYWQTMVDGMLRNERMGEEITALVEATAMESDLSQAILLDRTPATVPAEEEPAVEEPAAETDAEEEPAAETDGETEETPDEEPVVEE